MAEAVNYNDERFRTVEADKKEALTDLEQTYGGMISESDEFYKAQVDASKQWADKQTELRNEQTDFAIEQIEQQKQQAQKDYTKEQSGAYADWQKESGRYGANAEQMAAQGFAGSGYGESAQVSMYNTYQNRVAAARESYNKAVLDYNNAIKEARLQNSSALAEIAYNALLQQFELSLQGFQYKNQLILEKAGKKTELDNAYYSRYMDVLQQINTENAMAEEIRQYNQSYALQKKEYEEGVRQFNEEIARLKENDAKAHELDIRQLELQRDQLIEEQRQYNISLAAEQASAAEDEQEYDVYTGYYKGDYNSDALKYGTFANGYQPKGITGHGLLSKSGETVTVEVKNLKGQQKTRVQNVWEAEDGTLWYWDGANNKYVELKEEKSSEGKAKFTADRGGVNNTYVAAK